ncbi:hypothetical protein D3C85_1864180 [compost metagenome]
MDDNPAVGQFQQQVLGATLHAEHRLITESVDLIGNRPAQATIANDSMKNGCAYQMRLYPATAGFYLR